MGPITVGAQFKALGEDLHHLLVMDCLEFFWIALWGLSRVSVYFRVLAKWSMCGPINKLKVINEYVNYIILVVLVCSG